MKPIIFSIAIVVSLAVSIALLVSLPNIDLTESEEQSKQQPKKLYTIDDLVDNPELYNLSEATQIISKTYNDLLKECEKLNELNSRPYFDCTDDAYYWWQEASLIIQQAYQGQT